LKSRDQSDTSERLLECIKFRLRDNFLKFVDQEEVVEEMKQTKCKVAFLGRWLHNQDELKFKNLKKELLKDVDQIETKKRKLDKAKRILEKAKSQAPTATIVH